MYVQELWEEIHSLNSILDGNVNSDPLEIDYGGVLLANTASAASKHKYSYGVCMRAQDFINFVFNNNTSTSILASGAKSDSKQTSSSSGSKRVAAESKHGDSKATDKPGKPAHGQPFVLSVDAINHTQPLTQIRNALIFEKRCLEQEVGRLSRAVNDEADECVSVSVSACPSPRMLSNNCGSVNNSYNGSQSGSYSNSPRPDECVGCGARISVPVSVEASAQCSPRPGSSHSTASTYLSAFASVTSLEEEDSQLTSDLAGPFKPSHGQASGHQHSLCRRCRGEKLLHGRLPKQHSSIATHSSHAAHSNAAADKTSASRKLGHGLDDDSQNECLSIGSQEDSITTPVGLQESNTSKLNNRPKSAGGVFRSKIRAAMDEHHFFDEMS